jgi:ketosteroid isomerase-like protein
MMKAQLRATTLALALVFPALPAAAQQRITTDTALASMVAAERAFSKHSLERGAQDAFLLYMSDDAFLYRPKVVRAHAFLRSRPMPRGTLLTWDPSLADVSASGDLGYTTGEWISSRRDFPDAPPTFGQYATIWRRQMDGEWKAELNVGIAHEPDAVGVKSLATAAPPEYRSATRGSAADKASLFAADSALAAQARSSGAAPAFQGRAGQGMRLLRMGRFPIRGDSATSLLRATPTYRWQHAGGGISAAGDLGYTYGVYSIAPQGRNAEGGDYLRIWRRDRAGVWRVVLDLTSPAR